MKQAELAEAARIPLRTLKAWETEKQPDSLPVVLRIADALGVTLDQLAGVPERGNPAPAAPEVVVDGVLYAPTSGAGSDPAGPPTATRDSAEKAAARKAKRAARKPQPPRRPRPPSA